MRIERKKNASRNIIFGLVERGYNLLMPFLMRTAMIHFLSVEYLGLSGLFTSVLQVLNLAELGVGSAMVFSMYKPIAEDDVATVCALMKLYRRYYRIIGAVVMGTGLILLPFIPRLIHGDVPEDINVYYLYLLNLTATALSYWLFAYRNSLLNAYQRNDVRSKIALATNTAKYIIQFLVLALLHNYYWYVIVIIITQILNNIITAVVSKDIYPQYKPQGTLSEEEIQSINHRVRDVFTAKLGGTILNSADTIVISAFLGLRLLAIYQNYYYILTAVSGIFTILFSSLTAGVGNSLVLESKEKNYQDYRTLTVITCSLMAVSAACMIMLYQPFISVWVGKDLLLSMTMVVLFCVYFVIVEYVMLASVYKDAAGIWHQDRLRPLSSGLVNLFLNLLMVKRFGLYGIVISTILSAGIVSAPWITSNLFKFIFPEKLKDYLPLLFRCLLTIIVAMTTGILTDNVIRAGGALGLVVRLFVSLVIGIVSCVLILGHTSEFGRAKNVLLSMIRK